MRFLDRESRHAGLMLAGLCAAVLALVFVSAMCRSEPGADWSDVSALFWESLSADVWDE